MPRNDNVTMEDVTIAFRNFAGNEDKFNPKGKRNFAILLKPEDADNLERTGWNVKYLKPRDDEPPQAYLPVAVSYESKPPKIILVTSRGKTYIDEDSIESLDWVDIEEADVTLNPYDWEVNGNSGRKAYVKTLIIKAVEDYLEMKWDAWVEGQRALPSGNSNDYIDGEIVDDALMIER